MAGWSSRPLPALGTISLSRQSRALAWILLEPLVSASPPLPNLSVCPPCSPMLICEGVPVKNAHGRRPTMQFAIAIPTDADSWRVVRRAEELGFARVWFYDTQMLSADPFVAMAAAAVKTTKIRLGTGVLIPSNRIAPVTANAFASLNKLAPGRIDFGIGTGFTGRRGMGLGEVKLADMEEYVRTVMALLRGETVEAEIERKKRLIRLLNPELGLIHTRDTLPLWIAAAG